MRNVAVQVGLEYEGEAKVQPVRRDLRPESRKSKACSLKQSYCKRKHKGGGLITSPWPVWPALGSEGRSSSVRIITGSFAFSPQLKMWKKLQNFILFQRALLSGVDVDFAPPPQRKHVTPPVSHLPEMPEEEVPDFPVLPCALEQEADQLVVQVRLELEHLDQLHQVLLQLVVSAFAERREKKCGDNKFGACLSCR